jgi:hypothetical protein
MGKLMMTLPWGFRNSVLNALVEGETRHGRPVKRNEIYVVNKETSYLSLNVMLIWMILNDLYRNDELLADYEGHHYSLRPEMQDKPENPTGFELYSDRMKR